NREYSQMGQTHTPMKKASRKISFQNSMTWVTDSLKTPRRSATSTASCTTQMTAHTQAPPMKTETVQRLGLRWNRLSSNGINHPVIRVVLFVFNMVSL